MFDTATVCKWLTWHSICKSQVAVKWYFERWHLISIWRYGSLQRRMTQILWVSTGKLYKFMGVSSKQHIVLRTCSCEKRERRFNKSHTKGGKKGKRKRETKEGTQEWMTAPRKEIRKHFLCSRGEKTKECYSLLYHLILVILNVVLRRVALIPYLRIRFVSSILSHSQNKRSRWDTLQELDDRAHRMVMSQPYKNRGGSFEWELAENFLELELL